MILFLGACLFPLMRMSPVIFLEHMIMPMLLSYVHVNRCMKQALTLRASHPLWT